MLRRLDEFFAELDGLTEKEIEARLPTWDMERLTLAQEYVEARLARPTETQSDQEAVEAAKTAASLAMQAANGASRKAIAALILSVSAMLAAVLCGIIVVLR